MVFNCIFQKPYFCILKLLPKNFQQFSNNISQETFEYFHNFPKKFIKKPLNIFSKFRVSTITFVKIFNVIQLKFPFLLRQAIKIAPNSE